MVKHIIKKENIEQKALKKFYCRLFFLYPIWFPKLITENRMFLRFFLESRHLKVASGKLYLFDKPENKVPCCLLIWK